MSTKKKYHSEIRQAQAAATRRRILAAARRLFSSRGFEKTTVDEVAVGAEVSTPTIYMHFKSKEGVLRELVNEVLFGPDYRSLVDKSASSKDPREALRIAAHISRTIHDAEKSEIGLVRGASALSPELRDLELEGERLRYERQRLVVARLEKARLLPRGMGIVQARDILWSLTSREVYRMLVIERGWSSDEYQKWLAQTLLQILVGTAEE
jgi:AcrR family transcriptional regulator